MLTLDIPTEPYWIELPRGVRLKLRPCTTAIVQAAQARAAREAQVAREAFLEDGVVDPDMARGLAFALLCKGLARHAVLEWEGVGDADGNPIPVTPPMLDQLMDLDEMAAGLFEGAMRPLVRVSAEGNA
jgi:hypothetical protein